MTWGPGVSSFGLAMWLCGASFAAASQSASAQEPPKNFVLHDKPAPVAQIAFDDAEGHAHKLQDFSGKVLVLNVWATWCVPCRTEMPTLDRLQGNMGSADFEVVPVSIDRGGIETVRKFYGEIGVHNLAMYADSSGQVLRQVGALGLPTTLLVDRSGHEIGRVIGPAEWDSAEVMQFLKPIVAQRDDTASGIGGTDNAHVAETNQDAPDAMQRGLQWLKSLFGK